MTYDRLAESERVIESGITADPHRLSRRCRFAAIAYDVHADIAATWFVRRGHPVPKHEIHLFGWENEQWRLLAGGGFGDGNDHLSDRPDLDVLGTPLAVGGGGGLVPPNAPHLDPVRVSVGYVTFRAASPVVRVALQRGDSLSVPRHGNLIVAWRNRAPVAHALDAADVCLASVDLGTPRGLADSLR